MEQEKWKPTQEQLEALHTAAYLPEMEFYGGLKYRLRELYEQLITQTEKLARELKEEIPNYLNEVADYARKIAEEIIIVIKKYDDYSDEQIEEMRTYLMSMFLEGTVWQNEKMMEKAVEGEFTKDNRGNNVIRAGVFNKDFEYGDKVRVIVLKKED